MGITRLCIYFWQVYGNKQLLPPVYSKLVHTRHLPSKLRNETGHSPSNGCDGDTKQLQHYSILITWGHEWHDWPCKIGKRYPDLKCEREHTLLGDMRWYNFLGRRHEWPCQPPSASLALNKFSCLNYSYSNLTKFWHQDLHVWFPTNHWCVPPTKEVYNSVPIFNDTRVTRDIKDQSKEGM